MMIYSSYYAKASRIDEDSDIIWVPVSNTIPHWFEKSNMINPPFSNRLAPPWNIINPYKSGEMSREEFAKLYEDYLEVTFDKDEILTWITDVQELHMDHKFVLLCFEKNPEECHRSVLCEWLGAYSGEL